MRPYHHWKFNYSVRVFSYNYIWGRSKNPWDLKRTPGGSSGGDAALVAMGCVPLTVSSDVAGSIRIPGTLLFSILVSLCGKIGDVNIFFIACFSGVVGFKPTSTRLSGKGSMKPRKVRKSIGCAASTTKAKMYA